ncbi:MAG: hypothetical protein M1834_008103 [Cirrosporium novae-zelandiae]|nr:MAG: hypothetical protein M1834_008103 [Cirrosporium novae-zelandiae]
MTTPPGKQPSRWGSFFEKTLAGVESRLDNILSDEADLPQKPAPKATPKAVGSTQRPSIERTGSLSRTSSQRRTDDRLQERLAKAMIKANGTPHTGSPRSSIDQPSRPASPALKITSPRPSLDVKVEKEADSTRVSVDLNQGTKQNGEISTQDKDRFEDILVSTSAPPDADTIVSQPSSPTSYSQEGSEDREPSTNGSKGVDSSLHPTVSDADFAPLRTQHEASELRWQEEVHSYIEKIDALQSKLQYLTREAAESARKVAVSVDKGSLERKLAEKDEQIALLMEEGQNLSKAELKYMNIIKSLRVQAEGSNKSLSETQKRMEKLERDRVNFEEKAKRAEMREKKTAEKLKVLPKIEKEIEEIKAERASSMATIGDLQEQLVRAVARAEEAESRVQMEATEAEKQKVRSLLDDLSNAKIERELSEEKLKRQIRDLKEQAEREKERARTTEVEHRSELASQESRLEALRSRAEEASSGNTGDAQAKLLRQIEMLQTQYTVASENWQGIEGSLLSRISHLEKERDEMTKREGDMRKKGREANTRSKRLEEELEGVMSKLSNAEQEIFEKGQQLEKLQQRLDSTEKEFVKAKKEFSKEQQSLKMSFNQQLDDERAKWQEEHLSNRFLSRNESPVASSRHHSGADISSLQARQHHRDRIPSVEVGNLFSTERLMNRRPSAQPMQSSDLGTPPRPDSAASSRYPPHQRLPPEAPSIHTVDQDELFDGVESPATPKVNDLISVSTVAAGPSVQLVERMSAAVRRLESERAASKDELARLSAQRDEARQEVADLMREVEEKKVLDERIKVLEKELGQINDRYQTTLEMLGEKSEQVDELQADIADLKKIYRELVDSTMK